MNLRELRESHFFWRSFVMLTLLYWLLVPTQMVLAQGGGADSGGGFVNTGNNPGNPTAPGYFGGGGTGPGTTAPPSDFTELTLPDGTVVGGVGTAEDGSVVVTTGARETLEYASALSDEKAYGIMVSIGGWFAGFGGNMFELSFENLVIRLGCYFTTGEGECGGREIGSSSRGAVGAVVNELWILIRDLFNLAMIFSLIFIGFKLILNADDSGAKRALGSLIAAALLVNFSLYIAKVVVDIANFSAVVIYNQMIETEGAGFRVGGTGGFEVGTLGSQVAASFMQVLLVTSWFTPPGGAEGTIANSWSFAFFAMLFLIFLGAVFLYGAFMMLARFIAIIVLLIFSPLMFIGWVLPGFNKYSSKWWGNFVGYAFYAPVYVFFLYLSLYVLVQLRPEEGSSYAQAFGAGGSFASGGMGLFLYFALGAGMLLMSTKVAGALAKNGADIGLSAAGSWAKRATLGATAAAGTYLGASALTGAGWAAGNMATGAAESMERKSGKSSYTSRGLMLAGNYARDKKIAGVNTRATVKKTKDWFDDSVKKGDERAGKLKKEADVLATLKNSTSGDDIERAIIGMNAATLASLAENETDTIVKHAAYLRPDQVKALEENKDLDKATVKKILDARNGGIKANYSTSAGGPAQKKVGDAPLHELAALGKDTLLEPEYAISLSDDKIDKLPEPKYIDSDKAAIKKARDQAIISVAQGATVHTPHGDDISKATLLAKKPADIAKYPAAALKAMADELPIPALSKIVQDGSVSKQDQKDMRALIEGTISAAPSLQQNKAYDDWLKNSPLGKQFGQ